MKSSTIISAVAFDLDGTLVDSREGIEWAAREAVAQELPSHRLPSIVPLIGPPIDMVLRQALPDVTEAQLARIEEHFRRLYDSKGWRRSVAYRGVDNLLPALKEGAGLQLLLVTNKPWVPTNAILSELDLARWFEFVATPDAPGGPGGTKADLLQHALTTACRRPEEVVYVGDTADDLAASSVVGMPFIAAAYGYGFAGHDLRAEAGAEWAFAVSDPMQVLNHIEACARMDGVSRIEGPRTLPGCSNECG